MSWASSPRERAVHTARFQFLGAASKKLLNFFGGHFRSLPRVGPCGFSGPGFFDDGVFGGLLYNIGVLTPEDAGEERHVARETHHIKGECERRLEGIEAGGDQG